MNEKLYGYIRVSTIEQNDYRQRIELEKYGVESQNIFSDKLSGKDFNRKGYQLLRNTINKGDLLVIKSLDRLGRDYLEIQEEWRFLTKVKCVDIVVLDMPILDTRQKNDLIGTLISDIVLQLLSYVAQAEREAIRSRQAEGIAAAKLMGKHLGRPAKPLPENFHTVHSDYLNGKVSRKTAAIMLGISIDSFAWLLKKQSKKNIL